jgi:hypothetical protein
MFMSPQLEAVLKEAQGLSRQEQLELIRQLTGQLSTQSEQVVQPKHKVTEFFGVAPNFVVWYGCSSLGLTTTG